MTAVSVQQQKACGLLPLHRTYNARHTQLITSKLGSGSGLGGIWDQDWDNQNYLFSIHWQDTFML
eukprot:3566919-Rhodomonas_salina.1